MMRIIGRIKNRCYAGALMRAYRLRFLWVTRKNNVHRGKVFCVGRNKTGTTSLRVFFNSVGYRVAPQIEGEKLIYQSGFEPDERFWRWVEKYDVFQDAPFSWTWMLPHLIGRYPDAKFILSVRDESQRYYSLINHHLEHLGLPKTATTSQIIERMKADDYVAPGYFYAAYVKQNGVPSEDDPVYDEQHFRSTYVQHNATVRDSIPAAQLLEVDLSEHQSTRVICEFLSLPDYFVGPMPRENRRR